MNLSHHTLSPLLPSLLRRTLLVVCCLCLMSGVLASRPHRGVSHARSKKTAQTKTPQNETLRIYVDNTLRSSINIYRINAIRYCALASMRADVLMAAKTVTKATKRKAVTKGSATALEKGAAQATKDVIISNHVIHTVESSFFVSAETSERQRIAQMTMPTIRIRNTTLVPYPQFFDALASMGLCTLDEKEHVVRWVQESKRPKVDVPAETVVLDPLSNPHEEDFNEPAASAKSTRSVKESQSPSADKTKTKTSKADKNTKALKASTGATSKSIRSDAATESTKAVESQTPAPVEEQAVPLRYQLPSDLKRRELEDSLKSDDKKLNDLRDDHLYPGADGAHDAEGYSTWLASMISIGKARPARITTIRTEVINAETRIHFESDKNISDVPDPDFSKGLITLHFPGAVNAVKDLAMIRKLNVESVHSALEEGEQVYRIQLKSRERSISLESLSARHFVLHIRPKTKKTSTEEPVAGEPPSTPAPTLTSASAHHKWDLDVIVIDAGHGGKDVGAESIHKKYEKDITLAIALKLRDEIKKRLPNTKVVLTRSTDVFVELDKRGEIANKAGGKLFISIHCNSTPTRPTNASGFETYVLSPAKTNTAVEVAKRENAVIQLEERAERYKGLNDDQLIVATLAQNSFVKFSSSFAALVQKNMKVCTSMCERSVNQAGFIVLIGASMPAVLVETGFVTNKSDEKMLTTASGQGKIARGIASAVKDYAASYAKMLKN